MRIWHVGAESNPSFVGGVSRTVWSLSMELARHGHDVSLMLDSAPTAEGIELAAQAGLKLHDVSASTFAYSRHMRELLETLPPQIVHMHSVFIPRQAVLARLLREFNIPYIITPHAGLTPQSLARSRFKKMVYSQLRERPRFMCAAGIALVTPAEEQAVRAYLPKYEGIVRWMPNPVQFELLDPFRWEGLGEQKRLVFLGRFDVLVKGIDILVEIGRLLPDVKIELYGTEDPKTRDWLLKLQQELPSNVSFHEAIFGQAKAKLLSGASMYIQPSRWEGFPVSVAECLYLGVPASIADTLDLAQLFREQNLGLVLSLKPEVAAAQIREALSDNRRLEEWSQRGREFASAHFSPAAVADDHIRLYQDAISTQAHPATAHRRVGRNGLAAPASGNGHQPALPPRGRLLPAHFRGSVKQNVSRIIERSSEMLGTTTAAARSVVLCYHSIGDDNQPLSISPDSFREQLTALRQMGFEFQTFGDFVDRVMRWGAPRNNVAVITFDDGFEDNFNIAMPILAEMNVAATFFITSGLMSRDSAVVSSFCTLTKMDASFLTGTQVRQMYEAGFEIGAHTHTHPNLSRLTPAKARWEVAHSKELLEQAISGRVRSFAYPFGKRYIHYTTSTTNIVRESGYAGAASVAFRGVTTRGAVRIFEVPRFFITRADSPVQFRQKVAGHFDWLGSFQELSPAWLKALVSPEDRY